jgi:hypothetical protein
MKLFFQGFKAAIIPAAFFLFFSGCEHAIDPASGEIDVEYSIMVNGVTNGSIIVYPLSGTQGTEINLLVNPNPGYMLRRDTLQWHLSGSSNTAGNFSIIDMTTLRFDLPASSVWISADFIPVTADIKTVSVNVPEHGYIKTIPPYGPPGTEVSVIIRADEGYTLENGSLTVDGTPISGPPYKFILPGNNVTLSAEFIHQTASGLVVNARRAMDAEDYDLAFSYYEAAYQQDHSNAEAVVYSTLGKLLSIANNPRARQVVKKFNFNRVPGTINEWFAGAWLDTYDGEILPKIEAPGGFPEGFINYSIYRDNVNPDGHVSRVLWDILLMWNIIGNNSTGYNDLLDDTLKYVLGDDFEEAAARTAVLRYDQTVALNSALKAKFQLEKWYGAEDTVIGRAELDMVISSLRGLKALAEWAAAYDWEIDISILKVVVSIGDKLNEILDKVFTRSLKDRLDNEGTYVSLKNILPLRNNFLTMRDSSMTAKSRADFELAVNTLTPAFDYLFSSGSSLTVTARGKLNTDYSWIPDGLAKLKTALNSGGNFYIPDQIPRGDTAWIYDQGSATYGVNFARFFTPGYLTLNNLITTDNSGRAPQFFGYNTGTEAGAVLITEPEQFNNYTRCSIQINTALLNEVFVKGFETYSDRELLSTVVPEWFFASTNGRKFFDYYRLR